MNIQETSQILAKIQSYDGRNVDDVNILSWQELLEPHTFQDGLEAVRNYYRRERRWIMPADVLDEIKDIEERRAMRVGTALPNRADAASESWQEAGYKLRRMIRRGEMDKATFQQYEESDVPLEQFTRNLKAIK